MLWLGKLHTCKIADLWQLLSWKQEWLMCSKSILLPHLCYERHVLSRRQTSSELPCVRHTRHKSQLPSLGAGASEPAHDDCKASESYHISCRICGCKPAKIQTLPSL